MVVEERWHREAFGGWTVLSRSWPDARWVFALGPRWAERAPEEGAPEILKALAPEAEALRWCRQVHGRLLASLSSGRDHALSGAASVGRCDGLMTTEPGVAVLVWTADCVPVLLHGDGVVAAVHAGWRGVVAGVVPAAVRRLAVEYGVPPERVHAALGPSVGPCHYEVGQEVLDALSTTDPGGTTWRHGDRVDLRALLEAQLASSGLPAGNVERVGGCTACDPNMASYRRDGERAGRQFSLALIPGCS